MTEESNSPTPSLRLKPRLRPPGEPQPVLEVFARPSPPSAAPAPAAPAPAPAPAAEPAAGGVKFQLRPKAAASPSASALAPETLDALRDPDATIPPRPRAPAPSPSPAAPAAAPAAPIAAAPAPKLAPPPPPPVAATPPPAPSRPPIPGYTAPPFSRTKGPFGKVPHIKAAVNQPPPVVAAPAEPRRSRGGLIAGLVSLVVFGVGGFFAWKHFSGGKPATAPVVATDAAKTTAAPAATAPASGSSPSDTLNKIAAIPGNAIAKAQDAIAARRASGQTRVDAAAIGEDAPAKTAPAKDQKAAPASNTTQAMTQLTSTLAATTDLEAGPQASPAFVAWTVNVKVNGVFQGSPARAMINNRLLRTGDTVDPVLGIVFDSVDADRKLLIFRDGTGAKVTRKY